MVKLPNTIKFYRLRMLLRLGDYKERLKSDKKSIVLLDADGVPNNLSSYPKLLEEKELFKPHKMTAGKKEIYERFRKEGFKCYNLCEVCFRGYNIRNEKNRKGILNIAPARNEKDLSKRTRLVFGVEIEEYGRMGFKFTELMSQYSVGIINGRNNCTLSLFDALANGLPVMFPEGLNISPEYLLTSHNHAFYKDEKTLKEGIEKLSHVNRDSIINDFVEKTKKERIAWKKMLGFPVEEEIKIIRL